jgi:hypothetical protein
MNRFQQGSLFRAKRKGCSDVWVFRWYDYSSGKRIYKKEIIGSVAQIRSKREAEKAAAALRSSINVGIGTPHTICDLAAHYRVHELTQEKKSFSTDNHRNLFKRYIEPRWGSLRLASNSNSRSRGMAPFSSVGTGIEVEIEVCPVGSVQPCDPLSMANVQPDQSSEDIAKTSPR